METYYVSLIYMHHTCSSLWEWWENQIHHSFSTNEDCYNSDDQILHATINLMTNYLLHAKRGRYSSEPLQMNPLASTASHLHQGQQDSLQLWKIKNILQQEIKESRHLQPNGTH